MKTSSDSHPTLQHYLSDLKSLHNCCATSDEWFLKVAKILQEKDKMIKNLRENVESTLTGED
jgi:hypothetical protein